MTNKYYLGPITDTHIKYFGIPTVRIILFIVLLFCSGVATRSQNSPVDSLRLLLPNSTGPVRFEILRELVINLWLNHPDSAMQYAREAVSLSIKLEDIHSQATAIRILGGVHSYMGTYDSSLYYSKKALVLSIKSNDSTLITSALNNIGFTYYHLGSYSEALENLLRALNMKYRIKQTYGLGQTLNNIGLVYTKLKDYNVARDYFNEATRTSVKLSDNNILLYSSNNIGFTYLQQGNLSQAEKYFRESLVIAKSVSNINWNATAYSGLGQTFYRMGLVDRARKQFKIALRLKMGIGDRTGISEIYYYLSKMLAASGELDSALIDLKISQQIALQIKSKGRMLENFDLFKDLYAQRKQYDSALFFQTKYVELRDKLFNENLARNLGDIRAKIQEEETIQRLADKDIQIQKQTFQAYYLVAIAIVTFVFALIVFRNYKVQKKLGSDLMKKNQEISLQKQEIDSQKEALLFSNTELEKTHGVIKLQNSELADLNNKLQSTVDIRTRELELANSELVVANLELDNFIYKSSHDIKGPLVRLLGVCHVALLDVQDIKAREYIIMLNDTAKHINDIFDRLKIVSDVNSLKLSYTEIDFDKVFHRIQTNLQSFVGYSEIEFTVSLDKPIKFISDEFLIETILHKMLENAVKFQRKSKLDKKFIRVLVKQEAFGIKISFVDNGIGIKENDLDHIFKMFSKAALEHQSVGLGLYIVKQCISKLGGSIRLVNNDEKLTEFEVKLSYT